MARTRHYEVEITDENLLYLKQVSQSRTEYVQRVERANILLLHSKGLGSTMIAKILGISVIKVLLCIQKAREFGIHTALDDFGRTGKPQQLTSEIKAWILSIACKKPKDLGYCHEFWTIRSLAKYVREQAVLQGHPGAARIADSTIFKLLNSQQVQPHKETYYVGRMEPKPDVKMVQVLHVFQKVECELKNNEFIPQYDVILTKALDSHTLGDPAFRSNHEYDQHCSLCLIVGMDLLTGEVIGSVAEQHSSKEFIGFLKVLDHRYARSLHIQIILDNHSPHTSMETRAYLETVPNRFEFVFTPKHGLWLNVIESLFLIMTRSFVQYFPVKSKDELKERIELYLEEINKSPGVFRWKCQVESAAR